MSKNNNIKKFIPLWGVIFVSFFCYASMLTMFIPLLQNKISPLNLMGFSLSQRNILSGVYLALYPLGQFFGSPIIGALSDKFGRKKMLIISLMITTICLLIIAYSVLIKSLILLAIGCFIAGLGESNMALALSAIADLTTNATRSAEFARAFVMCSVGYITGSLFGGTAGFIGYIDPFIIEAGLVLFIFFSIMFYFKEHSQQKTSKTIISIILTFATVFHKTNLRPYYLANFLSYIACFGVLRLELIYMQQYYQLSQIQISIFCTYGSVVALIANFLVTPFLLKRMTIKRIILLAGVSVFISSVIFIIPNNANYLWVTVGLISFFCPINVAMIGALISGEAEIDQQGAVIGNNQSLQVLAEALSAAIGGLIFALNPQSPFMIFALIGLVSIGMYIFNKQS